MSLSPTACTSNRPLTLCIPRESTCTLPTVYQLSHKLNFAVLSKFYVADYVNVLIMPAVA